jgi:hypothetical protein
MRSNSRLVTGDADGWIVIWSLVTKRPVAVWRAHEGTLLGARSWGEDKLITCVSPFVCDDLYFIYVTILLMYIDRHGKDYKLILWKFSEADESSMSVVLPVDTPPEPRRQPWVLHIIMVNTMNFCSFAQCAVTASSKKEGGEHEGKEKTASAEDELLIAVPNTQSSETVRFHTPPSLSLLYLTILPGRYIPPSHLHPSPHSPWRSVPKRRNGDGDIHLLTPSHNPSNRDRGVRERTRRGKPPPPFITMGSGVYVASTHATNSLTRCIAGEGVLHHVFG